MPAPLLPCGLRVCLQAGAGAPGGLSGTTWGNLIAALGQRRSQPRQCNRQIQVCKMDGHSCLAWPSTATLKYTQCHHILPGCSYTCACRHTFPHLPSCTHLIHPTPSQGFLRLRCPQEWPTDKEHLLQGQSACEQHQTH